MRVTQKNVVMMTSERRLAKKMGLRPHVVIAPHPLYLELCEREKETGWPAFRAPFRSELDDDALTGIRLALSQGQPLGSERFSEIMCAAVGVRRAQRKLGRPMVTRDQRVRVEDQYDFGFKILNRRCEMRKLNVMLTPLTPFEREARNART